MAPEEGLWEAVFKSMYWQVPPETKYIREADLNEAGILCLYGNLRLEEAAKYQEKRESGESVVDSFEQRILDNLAEAELDGIPKARGKITDFCHHPISENFVATQSLKQQGGSPRLSQLSLPLPHAPFDECFTAI